jgi:hypothetical protein
MIKKIILVILVFLYLGALFILSKPENRLHRLPKEIIECNKDKNCVVIIRNFQDGKITSERLVEIK